jgi:hypothetical protein
MNPLDAVRTAWLPVLPLLHRRGVPVLPDLEPLGDGAHIALVVPDEDAHHCVLLGSADVYDLAGPWLSVARCWVGGYRWLGWTDPFGFEIFRRSQWEVVEVEDPGSDESVADALAACWRTLRRVPCTEAV